MNKIIEIAENVFVISNLEKADSRLSWLPSGVSGFEPFNQYLFLTDGAALLIDTGVAAHRNSVLKSLTRMVGDRELKILVTRSDLDCIGNLGAIVDLFPTSQVLSVTKNLPLLGMVHVTNLEANREAIRLQTGVPLTEFGFGRLRPVQPLVRTLSTSWFEDSVSGTLFTSDFFSADLLVTHDSNLVRKSLEDLSSPIDVYRHLLAKFDWLERADKGALLLKWDAFFSTVSLNILAPSLGRIQSGKELVDRVILQYRSAFLEKKYTDSGKGAVNH